MYDNEPNEALVVQTHPKPIHAIPMAEAVKMGDQGGTTAPRKSGCRDPFFAALFLANLGIMIYFAAAHGVSGLSVDNNDSSTLSSILGDVSLGTMLGAAAVVVRLFFMLIKSFIIFVFKCTRTTFLGGGLF